MVSRLAYYLLLGLSFIGISKLCNILHIRELQRRLDEERVPITCLSLHPGTVRTPGVDSWLLRFVPWIVRRLYDLVLLQEKEGAMTSAFAAAAIDIRVSPKKYKG